MACEKLKKKIDSKMYSTEVFAARPCLRLGVKIAEMLVPLLDGELSKFIEIVSKDFDKYSDMLIEVLSKTAVDDQPFTPEVFDTIFAAKYKHMFEVIKWVVEVNGFLELKDIGAKVK